MKTVVITGATSGIGFAAARALLGQGFRVIGIGRCEEHSNAAYTQLYAEFPDAELRYFWGDLMHQREVKRIAEALKNEIEARCEGRLFALINNAGCARGWYTTSEEGYEQQFALNHLAGFLLTHYMLPYIKNASGRVIMTGSNSHRGAKVNWKDLMFSKRYHPLLAYKQSKLCNMLFASSLNQRYANNGIRAYVVDPGLVNTDIGQKNAGWFIRAFWNLRKRYGVSPDVPAATYCRLCEDIPMQGLYYCQCEEKAFSREVTSKNADRLFALSEELCGIQFVKENER